MMRVPAHGMEGVKKVVVDTVKAAGSSPCPPMVVGVGIGGTLELAGLCAKRAAMRDVDTRNPDPRYAAFEEELRGLPKAPRACSAAAAEANKRQHKEL